MQLAYAVKVPQWLQALFDGGIKDNNVAVITTNLEYLAWGFLASSLFGVLLDYTIAKLGPLIMNDLRVPLVIAVNRCDDRDQARLVAEYLGVAADVPAIPCQLIDPESGREVVAEVLVALLQSAERSAETTTTDGSTASSTDRTLVPHGGI